MFFGKMLPVNFIILEIPELGKLKIMRKTLLLSLLVAAGFFCDGQDYYSNKKDSLLNLIQVLVDEGDSVRVCKEYLGLMRTALVYSGYRESEAFYKDAKPFLPSNASDELIGKFLTKEGLYESQRTLEGAVEWYEKAIPYLKDLEDKSSYMDLVMEYAAAHHDYGKGERALEILNEGLPTMEKVYAERGEGERKKIIFMLQYYARIGGTHERLLNYGDAISYTQKAIDVLNENGIKRNRGNLTHRMGKLFKAMGEPEKAEEIFRESINLLIEEENKNRQFVAQADLALLRIDKGDFESAEKLLGESYQYFESIPDSSRMAEIKTDFGYLYDKSKQDKKAIDAYEEVIAYYKGQSRVKSIEDLSVAYTKLGEFFLNRGEKDKARKVFSEGVELSDAINSHDTSFEFYKRLYEIEKEEGDFEMALKYHESYFNKSQILYTDKAQEAFQKESVAQDVEGAMESKREAELKAALLSSRNQLYLIIAIALLSLLLLGLYFFRKLQVSRKEIADQNVRLQQLNTTKDKFFGIIAHDIRSPIVALSGVGEQMDFYLEKKDESKLKRLSKRVESTAKQLGGLLDNLLNWALLQQGVIPYHPRSLNVKKIAESNLDMFRNNANAKGVELVSDIDEHLQVNADESAMNTILRNLISNAIKFTSSGGRVSLSTELSGKQVYININDTGTGISAERMETLFSLEKKSEDGTSGEKGTGLGLNLVKELAELNKGILKVKSELEKGSVFSIGLPAA